jgi:hypothetical protein
MPVSTPRPFTPSPSVPPRQNPTRPGGVTQR